MHIPEQLPRETARDYALRTLKENIISLELAPGAAISENELADAMGISRTPVREALQELAKVRIVEIVPQKRSTVSYIEDALVEEAQFMRYHLETAVTAEVCLSHSAEDLSRLKESLALQRYCLESGLYARLYEQDDAFHREFYAIAHKPEVYELMKMLSIHFDRLRFLSAETQTFPEIVEEHEALLSCVEQKDAPRAVAVLQAHLSRYKLDAVELREKHPDYFK